MLAKCPQCLALWYRGQHFEPGLDDPTNARVDNVVCDDCLNPDRLETQRFIGPIPLIEVLLEIQRVREEGL